MGIRHFFYWFKQKFARNIYRLKHTGTLADIKEESIQPEKGITIDNLLIDMNGIFHTSAQKIYQYGNFKPQQRLLGRSNFRQPAQTLQKQLEVFKDICATIDSILYMVKPEKRVVLCVDGPAPLSKQNQQRQRRFMSALERSDDTGNNRAFDSNCITPGTMFMDYLTKYIDWYIRGKISENSPIWSKVEIIFSNEKAPGEGEHKCLNFIRKYGSVEEVYCIYGMDADLIMLSLGTHLPKFYILREDPMSEGFEFYVINVGGVRIDLGNLMKWAETSQKPFSLEKAINDFIFMCFMVGNDFLPHIPGIEIIEGGIDFMLDTYKNVCSEYGHMTKNTANGVKFSRKPLAAFLGTISQYEHGVLENKLHHREEFFPDPLLETNCRIVEGKYSLDVEGYRAEYYQTKLPCITDGKILDEKKTRQLCHEYLEGMQWVLSYYTRGVPNWKWRFPHHYAPFAFTIAKYVKSFSFPVYSRTTPTVPFIQLLSVLPPKSATLLPFPLDKLLVSAASPLAVYCPENFPVDTSGKRQAWEATVILPMVDYSVVEKAYMQSIREVPDKNKKRNILGKSFLYVKTVEAYVFQSYYGNISGCRASPKLIDL